MDGEIGLGRLCELFTQMANGYGRLEKEVHVRGAGQGLRLSEVHMIAAVGSHDQINITKLAKIQGVTKSAVSQMISRLVRKGFIEKAPSPETDNEVVLSLTQKGKEVQTAHERQHVWLKGRMEEVFSRYPEGTMEVLASLAIEIQELWKSLLDENS